MSREELENSLDFRFGDRTILVTYHPVTLGGDPAHDIHEFIRALEQIGDLRVIFTMPNSDTGRDAIADAIHRYVEQHPDTSKAFASLGLKRYLSTLQYVKAAVGNSSSGIIEVPSFGIPTLDIGDRQKGRLASQSVVHCGTSAAEVFTGLQRCLSPEFQVAVKQFPNPYDKLGTARHIYEQLKSVDLTTLQQKHFYDL